ncbi:MAG: hypothetical protein JWP25_4657 [Bradyrhizobium sp.]|nr:hypothetical protein [Bradyrhizobium sp.]
MKEPVDHVIRPGLPWRPASTAITECGYDASKVKSLTRAEFFQRVKDLGQQRSAMLTCMTCSDTARRWKTWEDDPRQAMEREIQWEWGHGYRARSDRGELLKDELIAIASLIEAHPEEFAATIQANQGRREWLEKKAARKTPPKPERPSVGGL